MSVYSKRGLVIRVAYLVGAMFWYAVTLGGRRKDVTMIVLCYHGISAIHQKSFQWQMKKVATRTALLPYLEQETGCCLLRPKVCVTFDDAFENVLENALPVLEHYQIPAIVFAVSENTGAKPRWMMPAGHPEADEITMTREQLFSLSKSSLIRIGSHTKTHPDLVKMPSDQVMTELADSKTQLEMLLGDVVEDLALPHGSYNDAVIKIARDVGYKRIHTLDARVNHGSREGALVGRFSMSPDMWKSEFVLTCYGAYSWLVFWRRLLATIRILLKRIRNEG